MTNTPVLSASDLAFVHQLDEQLKKTRTIAEACSHYKLNDYFILEHWVNDDGTYTSVDKTIHGFPVKYKVIHISEEGIPILQRVTSKNKTAGGLMLPPEVECLKTLSNHYLRPNHYRFLPDPDHIDAILLQQEYDPVAGQAEKAKLAAEINAHNKAILIPTRYWDQKHIAAFFKSLQPGDKFWTSIDKQFVIQSVSKQKKTWEIVATDMNKATVEFTFSSFLNKRLYKAQPRSFTREAKK